MKKFAKIMCLVLTLALVASCFAGCETAQQKAEKLAGRWQGTFDDVASEAQSLLENYEFYPEEIALCDLNALDYVLYVEFDTNLNYRFGYDKAGTQACVREYLDKCFQDLYAGRASLSEIYGEDFSSWSLEQFQGFYTELYSFASYDGMLDDMAEYAYDYAGIETTETGTFTFDGSDLMCTITGDTKAEALGYKISGDELTLTFKDDIQHYVRAN